LAIASGQRIITAIAEWRRISVQPVNPDCARLDPRIPRDNHFQASLFAARTGAAAWSRSNKNDLREAVRKLDAASEN
jgi:hypothetical protein